MKQYQIIRMIDQPQLKLEVATWFHTKWKIPVEAYLDSIEDCLKAKSMIPQWYVVKDNDKIIAGAGVIENDFHNRKDLSPNICAVYVEKDYRKQGIAGDLLNYICQDMKDKGITPLYLLTDHTSFYERYDWKFLCMVQGDGEDELSRMYIHD